MSPRGTGWRVALQNSGLLVLLLGCTGGAEPSGPAAGGEGGAPSEEPGGSGGKRDASAGGSGGGAPVSPDAASSTEGGVPDVAAVEDVPPASADGPAMTASGQGPVAE